MTVTAEATEARIEWKADYVAGSVSPERKTILWCRLRRKNGLTDNSLIVLIKYSDHIVHTTHARFTTGLQIQSVTPPQDNQQEKGV